MDGFFLKGIKDKNNLTVTTNHYRRQIHLEISPMVSKRTPKTGVIRSSDGFVRFEVISVCERWL